VLVIHAYMDLSKHDIPELSQGHHILQKGLPLLNTVEGNCCATYWPH